MATYEGDATLMPPLALRQARWSDCGNGLCAKRRPSDDQEPRKLEEGLLKRRTMEKAADDPSWFRLTCFGSVYCPGKKVVRMICDSFSGCFAFLTCQTGASALKPQGGCTQGMLSTPGSLRSMGRFHMVIDDNLFDDSTPTRGEIFGGRRRLLKLASQGLERALPRAPQRELLPEALRGRIRIDQERLDKFLECAAESHKKGYKALLHHQDLCDGARGQNKKAWRGRLIPLGAAPYLLMAPAFIASDGSKIMVTFFVLFHVFCALVLCITCKVFGSGDL